MREVGWTTSKTFTPFLTDYTNVAYFGGAKISHLSIYYDRTFDSNYLTRSMSALVTPYSKNNTANIQFLSDDCFYSRILNRYPNSMIAHLDSVLLVGQAQRYFKQFTTTTEGAFTRIKCLLNTFTEQDQEQDLHSFKIGELITLDNCSQTSLNNIWRLDTIGIDFVTFLVNGSFTGETGLFLIKRTPIRRRFLE